MGKQDRSSFIGPYGPADWLKLKQAALDPDAFKLEGFTELLEKRTDIDYVLDCGTGEGDFAARLYRLTKASVVCGADIYRKYLRTALKKQEGVPIQYQEADMYKLPFADSVFDLVGIQSTFDIMNGDLLLMEMIRVLKPGGWLYISMVYDTCYPFCPVFDEALENKIQDNLDVYALSREVSRGIRGGDARAGRKLWHYMRKYGLNVLRLTSSDWIMYPKPEYTIEERGVLHLLLEFWYRACLTAEAPEHKIDPKRLSEWYLTRQQQINRNELTAIVRQNSILAEKPKGWDPETSVKANIDLTPKHRALFEKERESSIKPPSTEEEGDKKPTPSKGRGDTDSAAKVP